MARYFGVGIHEIKCVLIAYLAGKSKAAPACLAAPKGSKLPMAHAKPPLAYAHF
jgi:hypothetical protein